MTTSGSPPRLPSTRCALGMVGYAKFPWTSRGGRAIAGLRQSCGALSNALGAGGTQASQSKGCTGLGSQELRGCILYLKRLFYSALAQQLAFFSPPCACGHWHAARTHTQWGGTGGSNVWQAVGVQCPGPSGPHRLTRPWPLCCAPCVTADPPPHDARDRHHGAVHCPPGGQGTGK